MTRKQTTIITHPDGTKTTQVTTRGTGVIAKFFWFLLAVFVLVFPAAQWGAWSIFVYLAMAILLVVGLVAKANTKAKKAGTPLPLVAKRDAKAEKAATPSPQLPRAALYQDPWDPSRLRYWDGHQWTGTTKAKDGGA